MTTHNEQPEPPPNDAAGWCALGELQAKGGRLEEAIHSFLRSIRADRRFVRPYLALGLLYETAGKTAPILRLYRSGLRHNPDALLLLERIASVHASRFEFREAFAVAREILNRRNLTSDYLRLGAYAVALGDLETAEKSFERALAKSPDSWEAHYNLGELYMAARLMDKARDHYRAALEAAPSAYEPLNGMGLFVLTVEQDAAGAVELLRKAIAVAPSRPEAYLNVALAHARRNEVAAATEAADAVLRLAKVGDSLRAQAQRLKATLMLQNRSFGALS
jgi:tetratricopeptide (TPR) repeat protein